MPETEILTAASDFPLLLRLGLFASLLGGVVSLAMGLVVVWQSPADRLNRRLGLLMTATFAWAFFAAWLRLTPFIGGLEYVRPGIPVSVTMTAAATWLVVNPARWVRFAAGTMVLVAFGAFALGKGGYEYYRLAADGRVQFALAPLGRTVLAIENAFTAVLLVDVLRSRRRLGPTFVPLLLYVLAFLGLGFAPFSSVGGPILMAAVAGLLLTRDTLRQQLFEPLKHANQRYRAVLDATPDQLILINDAGLVEEVDGAKFPLGDGSELPQRGDRMSRWFPGLTFADLDVAGPRFERTQRVGGVPRHLEIRVSRVEGYRLLSVRDVTSQRVADKLKDEFVSNVSHELRTPLTSIRGALGMVPLVEDAGERRELLDIAARNTERLLHLVNDLLDMQRIESGGIPLQRAPVEVAEVARHVAETLRPIAEKRGLRLEVTGGGRALADEQRLAQVLANLVGNALKFSPDRGTVAVLVTHDQARIRCEVVDDGPGVPDSFRDRLFQRFAQVDGTTTRATGGTGLGLAISRALVERMGGTIDYAPNTPTGSRFFFLLPAA